MNQTNIIAGFEYDADFAQKIRQNDQILKILFQLQKDGVARFDSSQLHDPDRLWEEMHGEYWTEYSIGSNDTCCVVHEIEPVKI